MERWLPVVGFEDHYEVSDLGRVRSYWPRRRKEIPWIREPGKNTGGYYQMRLTGGGETRIATVHRIVLEAFVGPMPDGMEIRHLDGHKTNNSLANLAYGTRSENVRDQIRHGHHKQAAKTHCISGHPLDLQLTTQRACSICRKAARLRHESRLRAAAPF